MAETAIENLRALVERGGPPENWRDGPEAYLEAGVRLARFVASEEAVEKIARLRDPEAWAKDYGRFDALHDEIDGRRVRALNFARAILEALALTATTGEQP